MAERTVRTYWWNEEPNFGDAMNALLLRALFGVRAQWTPLDEAELVAAGSVLQWITPRRSPDEPPIQVWGSGFLWGEEPGPSRAQARYCAVRGPRSAALGDAGAVPFGDPGILASLAVPAPRVPRRAVGLVPHLRHLDDPDFLRLAHAGGQLIDVRADPAEVIAEIAACEVVVSSSLHGLVVADSFGVPNVWAQCGAPIFGGTWKFVDYYAAFGLAPSPVQLHGVELADLVEAAGGYRRTGVEKMQAALLGAFPFADAKHPD